MITRSSSLWILRIGHVAVVTASVMIGPVDFAAAARNRVPSGRLVVQYTITAHARSGIVHGRLAATCVHPERRHQNFSAAADLSRIVLDFVPATRNCVPPGRLVVQYTITAHALTVIIHGRLAATCVQPERRHQDFSAAADLSRIVVTFFTAALCIIAVSLLHDCFVAALVGVVVVDLGSTAG